MTRTLNLTVLVVLHAAALAGCADSLDARYAPSEVIFPAGPVVVPMPDVRGLPSVDVSINGRGPFRLIIDTGADSVFLTQQAAREADLHLIDGVAPFHAVDGTNEGTHAVALGHIDSLQIGTPGASFQGFEAIVRDIPNLSEFAQRRIDGLLGTCVLRSGVWTLERDPGRLTIARSMDAPLDRSLVVPLTPIAPRDTAFSLRASIGGQRIDLLLDTGSVDPVTLSKADIARLLDAPASPLLRPSGASERATFFGTTAHATYQLLAPMRFGRVEWGGSTVIESRLISSIGAGALPNFALDLTHNRMILGPFACMPLPTP